MTFLLRAMTSVMLLGALSPSYAEEGATPPLERRALLIGIESYSDKSPFSSLRGSRNDVALVREVLTTYYGFDEESVLELVDRRATRRNIERAFEELIDRTRPGDLVYIHYSGHGSQVADASGDEGFGGLDSTLVPIDAAENPQILDDEIDVWLTQLRRKTSDVVLVVDACHSGTITRGPLRARGIPEWDDRDYGWSRELPGLSEGSLPAEAPSDRFVRISAALDHQLATEYSAPDGRVYGLLSWHWCQALLRARPQDTYREVFATVEAMIYSARHDRQTPVLRGAETARLFDSRFEAVPRTLSVLKNRPLTFRGGLLAGVTVGSIYETRRRVGDERPVARVEITKVKPMEATGKLQGDAPVEVGDRLAEVEHAHPFPPISLAIRDGGGLTKPLSKALEQQIGSLKGVELTSSDLADLTLLVIGGRTQSGTTPEFCTPRGGSTTKGWICFLDATGGPYGAGRLDPELLLLPLSEERDALERITVAIEVLVRNNTILTFASDYEADRPRVRVDLLELLEGDRSWNPAYVYEALDRACEPGSTVPATADDASRRSTRTFSERDVVFFRIHNDGPDGVYAYVANLGPLGDVKVVFPLDENDKEYVPPQTSRCIAPTILTDTDLTDTYVVFLTPDAVRMGALEGRGLPELKGSSESSLDRLFDRLGSRARGGLRLRTRPVELATRRFDVRVAARIDTTTVAP
jgi:hypothetical protein